VSVVVTIFITGNCACSLEEKLKLKINTIIKKYFFISEDNYINKTSFTTCKYTVKNELITTKQKKKQFFFNLIYKKYHFFKVVNQQNDKFI